MSIRRPWVTFLGLLLAISYPDAGWSKAPSGIGGGGNLGLMVALDDDSYYGLGTDLYPEIGLWIELPFVRAGGTLGLIWRKKELLYSSGFGSYEEEETILIFPVIARLDIRPLSETDLIIGPFVGGGIGTYIVADGPHETSVSISTRVGLEIPTDYFTAIAELRFEPTFGGSSQLGGVMANFGMILKLPLE